MADLTSKIKLLIQSQDGANQDAKLFPILPIPATVGDALTCSRALATATRVNSAGAIETVAANMPRITWERGVDQCPNLQVEKQVVQMLDLNESFVGSGWGVIGVSLTQDSITAPDGTLNGVLVTATATGADKRFQTSVTVVNGTTYTSSIFAKKGTAKYCRIIGVNLAEGAFFNLETGEIGTVSVGVTATMEDYGNGWYRCSLTQVSNTTSGYFYVTISDNGVDYVTTGNTYYVWGAQLEVGAFMTSYIPRPSGSAVTRNADVISKTGIGTLLAGAKGLFVDCYLQAGSLSDGVARYTVSIYVDGNTFVNINRVNDSLQFDVANGGVFQAQYTATITTPFKNKRLKVFIYFDTNNVKFYLNGALLSSDTGATFTVPYTAISIGAYNGSSLFWDGLIKAVAVTDEFTEADIEQISSYPSFANMAEQMVYDFVG